MSIIRPQNATETQFVWTLARIHWTTLLFNSMWRCVFVLYIYINDSKTNKQKTNIISSILVRSPTLTISLDVVHNNINIVFRVFPHYLFSPLWFALYCIIPVHVLINFIAFAISFHYCSDYCHRLLSIRLFIRGANVTIRGKKINDFSDELVDV